MEQIRQAWVGYQVTGAEDLWREFNTRFPYIDETRDWWIHATDRIVNHSYFADDIMRARSRRLSVIRTDDYLTSSRCTSGSASSWAPPRARRARTRVRRLRRRRHNAQPAFGAGRD